MKINVDLNIILEEINTGKIAFKTMEGHSYLKGIYYYSDDFIIKEINSKKIKSLYEGQYSNLVNIYYENLSNIIPTIKEYKCFTYKDRMFEITSKIENTEFIENNNIFSWEAYKNNFKKIYKYVDEIKKYNDKKI